MDANQENKLAAAYGFTAIPDDRRGYQWCKFRRDSTWVWNTGTRWAIAVLDSRGHFRCHEYRDTLEAALNHATGNLN